jgi:1-acyl-sn-glycerol-3-phosphate acyltransferase
MRWLRFALAALWSALIFALSSAVGLLFLGQLAHILAPISGRLWARPALALVGVQLEVRGREHLRPGQAAVVVVNHSSFLDMLAICAVELPGFAALAKREFLYIPLVGVTLWANGVLFINRSDRDSARGGIARLRHLLRRRPRSVLIFPEGTRSRDGQLQPFKMGAFHLAAEAEVPIIPIVFHGLHELCPTPSVVPRPGRALAVIHPPRLLQPEDLKGERDRLQADYQRWLAEDPRQG